MTKQPIEHNHSKLSLLNFGNHASCIQASIGEYYRNHKLTFTSLGELSIGEIFKNEEKLAYCEALDIDSARQYCKQIVDEYLSKNASRNTLLLPSANEIAAAFRSIKQQLAPSTLKLLFTHIERLNTPIDSDELKNIGTLNSTTEVIIVYADFARLLCDALNYAPPLLHSGQDIYFSMAFEKHECHNNAEMGLSISLAAHLFYALRYLDIL